jgi:hypothetical protein
MAPTSWVSVGRNVLAFWPLENTWFEGKIVAVHASYALVRFPDEPRNEYRTEYRHLKPVLTYDAVRRGRDHTAGVALADFDTPNTSMLFAGRDEARTCIPIGSFVAIRARDDATVPFYVLLVEKIVSQPQGSLKIRGRWAWSKAELEAELPKEEIEDADEKEVKQQRRLSCGLTSWEFCYTSFL